MTAQLNRLLWRMNRLRLDTDNRVYLCRIIWEAIR